MPDPKVEEEEERSSCTVRPSCMIDVVIGLTSLLPGN
jgi:hypothetical protein